MIPPGPDQPSWYLFHATHFPRIVARNFDSALHGVFSDFQKTQTWLQEAANARNDWAHPRTGDMLAGSVAHALYAMAQVLAAAHLPEAGMVETIRKDVVGMPAAAGGPEPAPVVPQETPAIKAGELPYWWQVCEPHDGFKNPAAIDESLLSATKIRGASGGRLQDLNFGGSGGRRRSAITADMTLLAMKMPIPLPIPIQPHRPQIQQRLRTPQLPAHPCLLHPVLHQVPTRPLHYPGPDGPALS